MFEIMYKRLILNDFGKFLEDICTSGNISEPITNFLITQLLRLFEVDGLLIKEGDKEIGNYCGEFTEYFTKEISNLKLQTIELTKYGKKFSFHKYVYKNKDFQKVVADILAKFGSIPEPENFFNNLFKNGDNVIDHTTKEILLGYVFHLDDFIKAECNIIEHKIKSIKKNAIILENIKSKYDNDQRFSLINNVLFNIKNKISENDIIKRLKLQVQFGIRNENGGGSYFFFSETLKKFQKIDDLELIVKSPNEIMTENKEGLLACMRKDKRAGALWTIFSEKEFPFILKYINNRKTKRIWEIEKKVFFEVDDCDKNTIYFIGVLPFIPFETMDLYLYIVGKIDDLKALEDIRESYGYLSFYTYIISQNTKDLLETLKKEANKAGLKKDFISKCLQADLLDLTITKKANSKYTCYIKKLLNSYPCNDYGAPYVAKTKKNRKTSKHI